MTSSPNLTGRAHGPTGPGVTEPSANGGARLPPVTVPFYQLATLHRRLAADFHHRLDDLLQSSAFIGGHWLERFEDMWARYCDVDHAVGVGNGTDALELVLRGLGIGPGDEVIVPANTFVATAAAVVRAGARPVFVDVDPGTLLITEASMLAAIGPATAAVIVVHLYGQMPDMVAVSAAAERRGLVVIEDAAQAHGATDNGRRAGSVGRAGTFSFYPGKNLGALGDGGMVTTNDGALAERVRSLSNHGRGRSNTEHLMVGGNSRLDGLQAAFLSCKLPHLDDHNQRRRDLAAHYRALLLDVPIHLVEQRAVGRPVYHLLVAQVEGREWFRSQLARAGIGTAIHYPTPVHRQPAFQHLAPGYLPIVERAAGRIVSLPLFPDMSDDQIGRVCAVIDQVLSGEGEWA